MALDPRFSPASRPLTPEASVIRGDNWRVTVLTGRLLRLEYSADGAFEDRATQIVIDRDFPTPLFTATRKGPGLQVRTAYLTLDYDGRPFSPDGLSVTPTGGAGYRTTWRYGIEQTLSLPGRMPANLGGTARTLDLVDGACPLEPGIMSALGTAVLDDSRSLALDAATLVAPRVGDVPADDGARDARPGRPRAPWSPRSCWPTRGTDPSPIHRPGEGEWRHALPQPSRRLLRLQPHAPRRHRVGAHLHAARREHDPRRHGS